MSSNSFEDEGFSFGDDIVLQTVLPKEVPRTTPSKKPKKEKKPPKKKKKNIKVKKTKVKPPKGSKPKLKKGVRVGLIIGSSVLLLGIVGLVLYMNLRVVPLVKDYTETGRSKLDTYLNTVRGYDPKALDDIVGVTEGDSYLAQELLYANGVEKEEAGIKRIASEVSFIYPSVLQVSTKGEVITTKDGGNIQVMCDMDKGEEFGVEIPDYAVMLQGLNIEEIRADFVAKGYSINDYDLESELKVCMCDYIKNLKELPKEVLTTTVALTDTGVVSDAWLDTALYGSEKFRDFELAFSQACLAEGAVIPDSVSTDWYGAEVHVKAGDYGYKRGLGTMDSPASILTPIITKVLGSDNKYHDIKIELNGYAVGQRAVDFAVNLSKKNTGFTADGTVKLACYQVWVTNLESAPITIDSEMALCDKAENVSSRTGVLYGFTDHVTAASGERVQMSGWLASTELSSKYLCWGASFSREFPIVYFDALSASQDVPSYALKK